MRAIAPRALAVGLAVGACASGDPADPSAPAPAVARDSTSGARLLARRYAVGDAIEVHRDFFDQARGEPCAFADSGRDNIGPGLAHYCLPLGMALHTSGLGPFGDAKCETPVAVSPPDAVAAYAVLEAADACAAPPRVFRVASATTSRPWILSGGRCVRASAATRIARLAEEIALDAFVSAAEAVEDRGGRVGALVLVANDGARQEIGAFDRERSEAVRVGRVGASLRWVPERVAFVGATEDLYADDACAGAALATKIARDAVCPLSAALVFEGACGDGTFHALGAAVDPSRARRVVDDACVAAPPSGSFLFEVGAPILAASFAEVRVLDVGGTVQRRAFADARGAPALLGDLVDASSGEPCAIATGSDGALRCLPAATAEITLFADDACSARAFAEEPTGCETSRPPRFVRAAAVAGADVFEVVGAVARPFTRKGGACSPVVLPQAARAYAVEEVDVTRFPLVVETSD